MSKTLTLYSVSIIYKLANVFLTLLNSILLNRCLGVTLRGDYTTIITIASLFQLILNLGVGYSYPSFKIKHPSIASSVIFSISCVLTGIYSGIILLLLIFGNWQYIFIGIISVVSAAESILLSIAVIENVKKRNLLNIWTTLSNSIFLLVILFFFAHNLTLVLISVIINHIILSIVIIKSYRLRWCKISILKNINLRPIFSVGFSAMLMNILIYLNYHADILFLGFLNAGAYTIGIYGTAVTLGNMLWIIPDAFKDIILYRVSIKDDPSEIIQAIVVNFIICILIVISFIFLGKWLIVTMYGKDFAGAFPITLIIFLGTFPMILYKLIHPIYIAKGNMKPVVYLLLLSVIINTLLDIVLIPKYEGYGAAIASVISYSVCGIAFLIKFVSKSKVNIIGSISKLYLSIKLVCINGKLL